jgi:hypothetical protein
MTTNGYVIAYDTWVDGWQCERSESGDPVIYATKAKAEREIAKNRMDIPDLEEFVVPVEEYLEGRKAIWTGQGITIEGTPLQRSLYKGKESRR